jgi:hypothetical protein
MSPFLLHVVHAVVLCQKEYDPIHVLQVYFVSLVEREVVVLPWDTRTEHHTQEDAKPLCRAYFKLDEALRIPRLLPDSRLSPAWCLNVKGLRVIDVGAAPGGWSQCLLVNMS